MNGTVQSLFHIFSSDALYKIIKYTESVNTQDTKVSLQNVALWKSISTKIIALCK